MSSNIKTYLIITLLALVSVHILKANVLDIILVNSTTTSCNSNCDATFSVLASNGTPPYQYNIGSGSPQLNGDFSGICAGQYMVYVEDGQGNTDSVSVTIDPYLYVGISFDQTIVLGESASLNATVSGGTPPYVYDWSPALNIDFPTAPNVIATPSAYTIYTLVVTDAAGCTNFDEVIIDVVSELSLSVTNDANSDCAAGCNASATVSVNGGTGNYTYYWYDSGETTATATNLCPGKNFVSVNDGIQSRLDSVEIFQSTDAIISGTITQNQVPVSVTNDDTLTVSLYTKLFSADSVLWQLYGTFDILYSNTSATFSFSSLLVGEYIVKASFKHSASYQNLIPTYYGNTYLWNLASIITTNCSDSTIADIDLISPSIQTGNNSVADIFILQIL